MSITAAELLVYYGLAGGAGGAILDDVSTVGGAIDLTRRPVYTQINPAGTKIDLVSDGADVRTVLIRGRLLSGADANENVILTNNVIVTSVNTYERVQVIEATTTSASRTITATQHTGSALIATIPPNEVGILMNFINSFSDPAVPEVRYDKIFWWNGDPAITLTGSQIELFADPSGVLLIALEDTIGDSHTVANRFAAPAHVGAFVGVGVQINVSNSGNLTAQTGQGTWLEQSLAAGNIPVRASYTTQLQGNSI